MTCKTLEQELAAFREKYSSVRVFVFSDCLVYRCANGRAKEAANAANKLIEELGLSLVAIPNKWPANNTYVVQSNETSDL